MFSLSVNTNSSSPILEVLTDRNKTKAYKLSSPQFHIPSVTVLFLEFRVTNRKTARKLNQTIASSSSKIYFQKPAPWLKQCKSNILHPPYQNLWQHKTQHSNKYQAMSSKIPTIKGQNTTIRGETASSPLQKWSKTSQNQARFTMKSKNSKPIFGKLRYHLS